MKPENAMRTLEVWSYMGALLGVNCLMLTAAGIYQWVQPPVNVLAGKHATFWAGVALLLVGGAYAGFYWPSRRVNPPMNASRIDQAGKMGDR